LARAPDTYPRVPVLANPLVEAGDPNRSEEKQDDGSIQRCASPDQGIPRDGAVVITRPVRSPEIAARLADHLAHQVALEKAGVLFAAGPLFAPGSAVPEAGMFVLRAKSFGEAEAIAWGDPLHEAGLRTFTIQRWRVNEGSYTVTVNYSDQSAKIA